MDDFTIEMDTHIGSRILQARREAGLTQTALAQAYGVSPQQMQKYEKGINCISGGRLYKISLLLKKPIIWFYEGFNDAPVEIMSLKNMRSSSEISEAWQEIADENIRASLLTLTKDLSQKYIN